MRFDPAAGDRLELAGCPIRFRPHPILQGIAYGNEGRRGSIYQVEELESGRFLALKVFNRKFRRPELVETVGRLSVLRQKPGLAAAERRVVQADDPIVKQFPELQFAMLMPWISGKTWFDFLLAARAQREHLRPVSALRIAGRLASVVSSLEADGIAHTDISPGNVVINTADSSVSLIDIEEAFLPAMPVPSHSNPGSNGYRHPEARESGLWRPDADRFATAVLAAEMLILTNEELASCATDEGYFGGEPGTPRAEIRLRQALPSLRSLSPAFAQLFEQTWRTQRLADCPPVSAYCQALSLLISDSKPVPVEICRPAPRRNAVSLPHTPKSDTTNTAASPLGSSVGASREPTSFPGRGCLTFGLIAGVLLLLQADELMKLMGCGVLSFAVSAGAVWWLTWKLTRRP